MALGRVARMVGRFTFKNADDAGRNIYNIGTRYSDDIVRASKQYDDDIARLDQDFRLNKNMTPDDYEFGLQQAKANRDRIRYDVMDRAQKDGFDVSGYGDKFDIAERGAKMRQSVGQLASPDMALNAAFMAPEVLFLGSMMMPRGQQQPQQDQGYYY